MDAEEVFRKHLPVIGQIAESICRRNGVGHHDAEDFASDIRLRLCEDNFAVIRKFQGKSSFTTYLTVVMNKALSGPPTARLGEVESVVAGAKTRPSGPAARDARLQGRLYVRRRVSDPGAEARARGGPSTAPGDPRATSATRATPVRRRRGARSGGVGRRRGRSALATERDERLAVAEQALRRALQKLPDEDRVIIRMLYNEGLSVAEIARALRVEQQRLYPRIKQLLASLRKTLEGQGISADFLEGLDSS